MQCFEFFGIFVTFIVSDQALLATVRAAYPDGVVDAPAGAPAVEIRLELGEVGDADEAIRVDGARLTLRGRGLRAWADASKGRAHGVASARLVGDPVALAGELVDTLLLFLLTRRDRTPVHAAGLLVEGSALVLAGPSGSGKSTLTLAAMQRGVPILSDDTLYIQLQPVLRVWGFRRPLHVFPQDAPRFTLGERRRGGKLKAVVPLAPTALVGSAVAERAIPLLLERGEAVDLRRLGAAETEAGLMRLDAGFDLLPRESARAARALAGAGGWRLTLSRDPDAAIDFLMARLPSLLAEA